MLLQRSVVYDTNEIQRESYLSVLIIFSALKRLESRPYVVHTLADTGRKLGRIGLDGARRECMAICPLNPVGTKSPSRISTTIPDPNRVNPALNINQGQISEGANVL